MDIVYNCRPGKQNEELRYSIRSVMENLPHDNLWVVGGKPEWYTGNYGRGVPKGRELYEFLDKRYGRYKNGWQNVSVLYDNDENNAIDDI